jgi:hypothetical protein
VVILRRRSRNHLSGVRYFWRHRDHDNVGCPARFAIGARIGKSDKLEPAAVIP